MMPNETRSAAPDKRAWKSDGDPRRRLQRMVGPRRLKYTPPSPGDKGRWVSREALKTRSDIADGALVLWPGADTLANPQGPGMAVLYWRLMGAHGLSAAFTVDAAAKPLLFLLSSFLKPNG